MSIVTKKLKKPASFLDSLREFLTCELWKKAKKARCTKRRSWRWQTQPLLLTLLAMTWCCGDSQAERFEIAKSFTAVCLSKRRGPGQTVQGFQKALAKLPVQVFRVMAAYVRRRLLHLFALSTHGWIVFGVDGSTMACPRTAELEQHLDPPRKKKGAPRIWVTAVVHLRTGMLWAWRLGRGYNRERLHLRALLPALPATALLVADAGFTGYDLAQLVLAAGVSFLIRVSSKDRFYTENRVGRCGPRAFDGKQLWCWPKEFRKEPPLRVRLIRLRDRRRRQTVWLMTNVLESTRLSHLQAGLYYRWRWESECLFRTYKRTLAKVKLQSRTIRLVHREAEGALLATQLLLAQGARLLPRRLQLQPVLRQGLRVPRCSPRGVLLVIRAVILGHIGVRQRTFGRRLARAVREYRRYRGPKVKRLWPTRTQFKPLKPPKILHLTKTERCLLDQRLQKAA